MTARNPIVMVGGALRELPAGDTINGASGGGGGSPFASDIIVHGATVGMGAGDIGTNTVLGFSAGAANTTGNFQTFIGYSAGALTTSGVRNTVLGSYAFEQNLTGTRNTAVGTFALRGVAGAVGERNVGVGISAGSAISSAIRNTFVGSFCGGNTTTGARNTFIGDGAGSKVVTIGDSALANANTSGSDNTFIGYGAMGLANSDTNEIVIGAAAVGIGANTTTIGNSSTTTTKLFGNVNSNGAFTNTSDARLKRGILPLMTGLPLILAANPVQFNMLTDPAGAIPKLGFIAQEIREILPSSVYEMPDGTLALDKSELVAVLVKAVQEQQAMIAELRARLTAVETNVY